MRRRTRKRPRCIREVRMTRPSDGKISAAIKEAVTVLHLADSSDYKGALWDVIRSLDPQMAELLYHDEEAAYRLVHFRAAKFGE